MPVGAMSKEIRGFKHEIKRVKLFEVQRLVRRIRQLANKKGTEAQIKKNQRKVERFEKELEFLKDADVDEIAVRINRIEYEPDRHENVVDDDRLEDPHGDIDPRRRALNRIINSTKLQKLLQRIEANNQDSVGFEKESGDVSMPRLKNQQEIAKRNLKTKTVGNPAVSGRPQIKGEVEDDESNGFNKGALRLKEHRKTPKVNSKATTEASISPELEIDYEHESSSEEECSKSKKQKAMMSNILGLEQLLSEDDDGFLASSDVNESDFEEESDELSSPELKPKGLESCFVQTLSGVKERSGSKARNKQGKDKGKPSNNKGKKNRRGQRARQQMWEKVHGKGAKHLQKNKTGIKPREGKEPRKQIRKAQPQHSFKPKSSDDSLHPSWEAMKKKRSQETLKVEFKGQKIKFDDSD